MLSKIINNIFFMSLGACGAVEFIIPQHKNEFYTECKKTGKKIEKFIRDQCK